MFRPSKYGNRKTEVDGFVFDSKKEAQRYQQLKLMEAAGAKEYRLKKKLVEALFNIEIEEV